MRYSEWFKFVQIVFGDRPEHQRLGQWAFNTLYTLHPDMAKEISGTEFDPFHRDHVMPVFMKRTLDFVVM